MGNPVENERGLTLTEENVVDPKGIVQVYRDSWWWCIDGDPKRALFYGASRRHRGFAQCNTNPAIARTLGERNGYDKVAQMVQIPLAFVPWSD